MFDNVFKTGPEGESVALLITGQISSTGSTTSRTASQAYYQKTEMAEILTSLLGPAIVLGNGMFAPVKRQFNYLCCFHNNVQTLIDEAQKLDNARVGLQMQVDTDCRNTRVTVPEVTVWLDASNKMEVEKIRIEDEIKDVKSGCFAIKSRYLLSRKSNKTAEAIKVLREGCQFEQISVSAPPASMAPIPMGTIYEFETRKQIENEIMEALMGGQINMMGICGMGGLGKTTMAKKIMNRVRKENLFDEAVMVVVSQDVDMLKIQSEVAELMGLNLEVESLSARAKKIHDRLMQPKRFLLILDDVWGRLKLEELGIPCGSDLRDGCTIFLTSRSRDVLRQMDAQNIYAMELLSETEAWSLFREKAGACVDEPDLLSIAKEVAEECNGLPLALVTVGSVLKEKRSKHNWKCALKQLKSANPIDIPQVLTEVYSPIKLSYDFLDNPRARSLFLLCCLFPEDHYIRVEYLTSYGTGLGMFEEIRNLEEAREIVHMLLENLKSRFLLLDGRDDDHVKMHDVVRDVAIFIASSEGLLTPKIDYSGQQSINCTWISVFGGGILEIPVQLTCPNLRLLVLNNSMGKKRLEISDPCFFKGMKELNVLSFHAITFSSLPQTIGLLQNLQTLYLVDCDSLETISIIGELLSLEILVCRQCHNIKELSAEIGRLNRLKLLEVSSCTSLRRIAPGVISSLIQLEELKIVKSFSGWEAKGKEKQGNNASIGELEFLANLTSLEIEIEDTSLAAEEIILPLKIVKFKVVLPRHSIYQGYSFFKNHNKSIQLELEKKITLGKWVQVLLRRTETLSAKGDGSNSWDLAQTQSMKMLAYKNCSTVKRLTTSKDWSNGVFPLLEYLYLHRLPKLEEICDGPIPKASNSFGNLKTLSLHRLPELLHLWESPHQNVSLCNLSSLQICDCGKLHSVLPLAMVKDGLLQLKKIGIYRCEMLEQVFTNEENEKHLIFPKLEELSLYDLPRLTTFCEGSESIAFPLLHSIRIHGCPKLTSLVSSTRDSLNSEGHDGDSFHMFCDQKVSFGSLKKVKIGTSSSSIWCHQISVGFFSQIEELDIYGCNNIRNLFSSSVVKNLSNLKSLTIWDCHKMETMVENEEMLREKTLQFSSLRILQLKSLPQLNSFVGSASDLDFSSLESIFIQSCPSLEFLRGGSVIAPRLKEMHLECCDNITQFPLGFFNQLERLSISYCHGIKSLFSFEPKKGESLFSSSIATNLVNLKALSIMYCNHLVKVIEDECEEPLQLFPSLKELSVYSLPKLQCFGHKCDLHLPYLKSVEIYGCPSLEFLTMGSVSTPNLESIKIDYNEKEDVGDINGAIRLHYEANEPTSSQGLMLNVSQSQDN